MILLIRGHALLQMAEQQLITNDVSLEIDVDLELMQSRPRATRAAELCADTVTPSCVSDDYANGVDSLRDAGSSLSWTTSDTSTFPSAPA